MENLLVYSWAIIVILLVALLLYHLLFVYNRCPPEQQISLGPFYIVDKKLIGSDVEIEGLRNNFYLTLKNNFPNTMVINSISITKGGIICGNANIPVGFSLSANAISNLLQGTLLNCTGEMKSCYNLDIEISYKNPSTGLEHTQTGYIAGSFEEMEFYWDIGDWVTGDYINQGNDVVIGLTDLSQQGRYLAICDDPLQTPPDPGTFFTIPESSALYWNLPTGCDWVSGASQLDNLSRGAGFQNVCDEGNDTAYWLAQGWIHNTLYVDQIFSGHTIYVGGDAEYDVRGETEPKTNGICLNDNIYLFVNNELVYWGGTSGLLGNNQSLYEPGDELIKFCRNCNNVDASGWCIPAFELTTLNFNFGETNNIDILVEDFCWYGYGQPSWPHAGGMSWLSITIA